MRKSMPRAVQQADNGWEGIPLPRLLVCMVQQSTIPAVKGPFVNHCL